MKRSSNRRRTVALGALVAALVAGALLASPLRSPTPRLPEGAVALSDPATHWSGFAEMVPPIRFPADADGRGDIREFLRVPEGAKIRTAIDERGGVQLLFPPGTESDRVEYRDGAVVDVRGTLLVERGEVFHVYRP